MVSFAALAGLTSEQDAIFYNIPPLGSSYIFELVTLRPEDDPDSSFPDQSEMYVRFYFQNGTDEYSRLTAYSLFGRGPSQTLIPYSEFVSGISEFSLTGIREWCETCGSYRYLNASFRTGDPSLILPCSSIFCPAYADNDDSVNSSSRPGLSPAVAGVIGAIVALAVAGMLFGLLMAIAGLRFHRQGGKRGSDLVGFKGSQKLSSDQDLTIPKGGAGAVVTATEDERVKGHERIGSWELSDKARSEEAGQMGAVATSHPRRPSYEDDDVQVNPYTPAVKPRDQV